MCRFYVVSCLVVLRILNLFARIQQFSPLRATINILENLASLNCERFK